MLSVAVVPNLPKAVKRTNETQNKEKKTEQNLFFFGMNKGKREKQNQKENAHTHTYIKCRRQSSQRVKTQSYTHNQIEIKTTGREVTEIEGKKTTPNTEEHGYKRDK